MMTSSPCSSWSLRALERRPETVMPGVASTWIDAGPMLIIASQSFSHSSSSIWPRRTRCMSTRASVQSMRIASCSAGISSENTAAFLPARMAAFSIKFMPMLVLPIDGRPATSTSSPGCRPVSMSSSSV